MRRSPLAVLLVLGACSQVFGLDKPGLRSNDAPAAGDGGATDGTKAVDAIDGPGNPLVQEGSALGSGSALTATLKPTTAGDLLVVVSAAASPISSVQGGGVTTWTEAVANEALAMWYGVVTSSATSVTVNYGGAPPGFADSLDITEWRGPTALDAASSNLGGGTSASASVQAQTAPDVVLFSVVDENLGAGSGSGSGGTPTPGSWNALSSLGSGLFAQYDWYDLTASAGTLAPSVANGSSAMWWAAVAAFKP